VTETPTHAFTLSPEELESFYRNGFIGPITIYEPDEMEDMWKRIRRATLDRSHAAYPTDALSGATNIANYDRHLDIDELAEHVCNPRIVDRVASILGPDVLCWRTEFFPKYPGDEGTDWHQADTFTNASGKPQILWPGETETEFGKGTITVWTAFTDATRENGCLQIIPGTHHPMNYDETKRMEYDPDVINASEKDGVRRGFFGYDYRQLQIDPNWKPNEEDSFSLVMRRGQCVIFWSTLMHSSLPNVGTGKNYRMGFAARYVPTSVRIYPDTDRVEEYGGSIPLDKYGAVIARGRDNFHHNRIARATLRGKPFPTRTV
jgi:non-heme Fe2+,alpha-ketoglutarate-dependent halogenase